MNVVSDEYRAACEDCGKNWPMAEGGEPEGPFEAYGVYGMNSKPWRRTFKSTEALAEWTEKYCAEVYGIRFDMEEIR
jgi:hypothetical protein